MVPLSLLLATCLLGSGASPTAEEQVGESGGKEPAGIQLVSGGGGSTHIWEVDGGGIVYNYRIPSGLRLPRIDLGDDYLHFNEVGGAWGKRARVVVQQLDLRPRAERRALLRAIKPYFGQLEACHLQHDNASERTLFVDRTEGFEVLVIPDLDQGMDTPASRCFETVLAKVEWPSSAPTEQFITLSWR